MKSIRHILILIMFALSGFGCASVPEPSPGKGALYGTLKAQSHKEFLDKQSGESDVGYDGFLGGIFYSEAMVNYPRLKNLYACLMNPAHQGGAVHALEINGSEFSIKSMALAKGDRLRVKNNSGLTHHLYLTDDNNEDGFQEYAPIPPQSEQDISINLEGDLELNSEEDESLRMHVHSGKGLDCQRLTSGDRYVFQDLAPGNYNVMFWFWRLGSIKHQVTIKAGQSRLLNETLSVDRVIH